MLVQKLEFWEIYSSSKYLNHYFQADPVLVVIAIYLLNHKGDIIDLGNLLMLDWWCWGIKLQCMNMYIKLYLDQSIMQN